MKFSLLLTACSLVLSAQPVFNVKDYGATGRKQDDARPALQQAIDACGRAGGGTVYVPPGEYTSGQLKLRSGVRLYIEAGATLFASLDGRQFDVAPKSALIYGEDLHDIALEGRGTVDGQASYVWRLNDFTDYYIRPNQLLMEATGKPLMRAFPAGHPNETVYPRLVLLLRCTDVSIRGLKFVRSRSWTINPYACKRLRIDGVYIYSDQKAAVWADGIDPDGCQDVRVSNSTIETGDDAVVFYSSAASGGPPKACENITITNCRLSSSSSAIKFCDGNSVAVRNVTISNCVITHSNRGIAFMVYDGGVVENVVIANVVIETNRFDWFWWGNGDPIYFTVQRRSESLGLPLKPDEPAAGAIRHVILRNIIAHGQGSCLILGHPDSWLDDISLENIKLFLSADPSAAYDRSRNAMQFRYARNLKVKDVDVNWGQPELPQWQSALYFQDVSGLKVAGFAGAPSRIHPDAPAVVFDQVEDATITDSEARSGTQVFLKVTGARSRDIQLRGNQMHGARPYQVDLGVRDGTVRQQP